MSYLLGNDANSLLGGQPRYFYALRTNDTGDLFITRIDRLGNEPLVVNEPGELEDDYTKFSVGIDFFNGKAINRERVYSNLKYDQYRWDDQFLSYYIDDDGILTVLIGKDREYPTDI
jgi:hypothetical protein